LGAPRILGHSGHSLTGPLRLPVFEQQQTIFQPFYITAVFLHQSGQAVPESLRFLVDKSFTEKNLTIEQET
jgi:hypothetical protein